MQNNFIKCFSFSLLALSVQISLQAQQLPVINQYIYNPYLYNPARTGQNSYGTLNVNFKRQWANIANSPVTGMLSAETPVKNTRLGVGGLLYSDRTHIINKIGGLATCAYHVPFSKDYKHGLSMGISLGIINQRFAFADATVANPADPQLVGTNATGTAFDFSSGLDYQWKNLHVGISMLQGLNNPLKYIENNDSTAIRYVNTRHWLFSGSYLFKLNKDFDLQPTILARHIKGIPFQIEGSVLANWRKLAYLGFGYRSSNNRVATSAIMSTVGVDIKQQIFFGYSFEFGVDAQMNASLGTQHEFMVRFRFGQNADTDKKSKELEAAMAEMKQQQLIVEKQLTENRTQIDSLTQNQINTQKELNIVKEQSNKNSNDINKLQNDLAAQNAVDKKQQEELDQINRELEEIRKKIGEKSPEFKKMGEVDFANGSALLDKANQSRLDALLPTFQKDTKVDIFVYGHASSNGDKSTNQKLSMDRAVIVRRYLIMKGINGDRIEILPFGATSTAKGDGKDNPNDRRAEIFVK
jgi:type IX secretion system PorP/SprF family membrane protein